MGNGQRRVIGLVAVVAVLAIAGVWVIQSAGSGAEVSAQDQQTSVGGPLADVREAVAVLHPTEGNDARGEIVFREVDAGMHISGRIEGLNPDSRHGFHIHEFGDCSAEDGTSAGGHYNPEGHPHALPPDEPRHAGDLGNIETDGQGVAQVELTVDNLTFAGERNPILGRGMIVHAGEDDGSQPTGAAGARLGCGVIGVREATP